MYTRQRGGVCGHITKEQDTKGTRLRTGDEQDRTEDWRMRSKFKRTVNCGQKTDNRRLWVQDR